MMENAYEQFYNKLFTVIRSDKTIKMYKHPKLSSKYIQNIIESIFTKREGLRQYEEIIRSAFGFNVPILSRTDIISKYNVKEIEFFGIIRKFMRSFYYSIYFRVNIYRLFAFFLMMFIILSATNLLFYDLEYVFTMIKDGIVRFMVINLVCVLIMPFIAYSKTYISSHTRHILEQYD